VKYVVTARLSTLGIPGACLGSVQVNAFEPYVNENPPGFRVAEHAWDGLDDMGIRYVEQCKGTNNVRRSQEIARVFNYGCD